MAKQTVTTTTRVRVNKNKLDSNAEYGICKNCGGDGIVRKRKKKKT